VSATTTPRRAPDGARRSPWRRQRSWLIIGAIVVVAVAASVLLGGPASTTIPLDPDNPGSGGAQAVARVLAEEGVDVSVVRSADALDGTEVDTDTTVVVTSPDLLGESTAGRLLAQVRGGRLVVVEPGPGAAAALGLPPGTFGPVGPRRAAECDDDRFADLDLTVARGTEYPTARGCYPGDNGFLVATASTQVTVLGASSILANDQILEADNAAIALRLLGQSPRLVWYVPDPADLLGSDGVSLATLLPDWIRPALWMLGFAALSLMLWRGRRLGPLATEPLPVVVKAIETTRSRGRLYRKVNDRAHAAHGLRSAARLRMAERLGLPSRSSPQAVATAVATRIGADVDSLRPLLDPGYPPPATDDDLIALASHLAALDREVRRS
jgi:Domain of unknown function (DUF4350)